MSAHATERSPLKLKIPERALGKEVLVSPFVPSDETVVASALVGADMASGKPVNPEHAQALAESVSRDMSAEGLRMGEKEKAAWKQEIMDGLTKKDTLDSVRPLPEDENPDPFDFRKVEDTLAQLTKTYHLEQSIPSWKMLSNTIAGNKILDNAFAGIARWFYLPANADKFLDATGQLIGRLPRTAGTAPDWRNVNVSEIFKDSKSFSNAFKDIAGTLAKKAWPIWFPWAASFPQQWIEQYAFKRNDAEIGKLTDSVNNRVAQSLIMQEFKLTQNTPPSEMMTTINRGRDATIELFNTVYIDLIPYMADLYSFPARLVGRSPLEGALAVLKIPFLKTSARQYAAETMQARKKELEQWNTVNAKILSTIGSLESIKTSDSMEKASLDLKKGMVTRDFIRSGGLQSQQPIPEGKAGKVFKFLDIGVPALTQVLSIPISWNRHLNSKRNALQYLRDNNLKPGEFDSRTIMNTVLGDLTEIDKLSPNNSGISLDNLTKNEQDMLGYVGRNKDKGAFIVESGLLGAANVIDSKNQQDLVKAKYLGLAALYVNKVLPLLQDIEKMEELLGPYDALDSPTGAKEMQRVGVGEIKRFDIKAEHLSFNKILNDVNLDIPQGSFATIKGASGIGKTTFMRHMLGLYEGDAGSVQYGGVNVADIKKFGSDSRYSKIGYAPQHFEFFENLTLRENLTNWTTRTVTNEEITKTLRDLNLDHIVDRLDSTEKHYSGGELRRIGIAQALLKNPAILFLDEPTANLDAVSSQKVMNIISSLRKKRPEMTVVAITHDPAFEKIAERVIDFGKLNKRPNRGVNKAEVPKLNDHQVLEAIARPR